MGRHATEQLEGIPQSSALTTFGPQPVCVLRSEATFQSPAGLLTPSWQLSNADTWEF